jgi:hypothetical protein
MEENHRKPQLIKLVSGLRFEPRTSQTQSMSINHYLMTFDSRFYIHINELLDFVIGTDKLNSHHLPREDCAVFKTYKSTNSLLQK